MKKKMMKLNWRPITEAPLDRPLFLFSPNQHPGNCPGGMVWVSGGARDVGGWRGDYGKEEPTHFAEIDYPRI